MGYYRESRKTGERRPLSPAQLEQFRRFQQKGVESRKQKGSSDRVMDTVETGLNVGFGGAALRGGVKGFIGKVPKVAGKLVKGASRKLAMGKAAAKYGGAAGYTLLGGLMLGEGVASLRKRRKDRKKEEARFSARKWS